MDVNEAFVSCVDKWASEEFDDRIDGAIDTFEEWISEYYGAAEPPVRCGESHLSGLTEPPHFIY